MRSVQSLFSAFLLALLGGYHGGELFAGGDWHRFVLCRDQSAPGWPWRLSTLSRQ
jgi:hypothetical protein